MKQERNAEVRNLQDELRKMEDRKDYYKNNFSKLKIVPTMKSRNTEQKPKPSKSSGTSTTPMSRSWRTLRRTDQNLPYL